MARPPDSRATAPPSKSIASYCDDRAQTAGRTDIAQESHAIGEIVAGLAGDPNLIAAARLSPLLRSGIVTHKEVENVGGVRLGEFAEQLNKMHRLAETQSRLKPDSAAQSEALRRLLLAIVSDVRLILIRLAEILYELRQAKDAEAPKRQKLASQVRDLYAPLANRLGVWQLKWELEDLSFRYLAPDKYQALAKALKATRKDREAYLERFQNQLRAELQHQGVEAEITGRPKHIYSIHRKLERKQVGFDALADLRAVRILVDDVTACYSALGVVHNLWTYLPHEFDDYIANPKANQYRSLHTAVIGPDELVVEVQIRTREMHEHAELGVAAHWRYKEGGPTQPAFEQKIRWLRQLLEPHETTVDAGELLAGLKDEILEDRVYAISPRGDIIDLPTGATPLDFAYQVHTMIGHRCRGAKVNGRIVNLTHVLGNGDQVEIITGKQPQPSRDWLLPRMGFLVSSRNRAKVRNWFRQLDRDQHLKQGREAFDREMQRLSSRLEPAAIATHLKCSDPEALYVALGAGDLTVAAIATAVQNLSAPAPSVGKKRRKRPRNDDTNPAAAVIGVDDLLSQLARCCRPLPPDDIGGYITQGRGITIHRLTCGNYRRLTTEQPDRIVDVGWSDDPTANYSSSITVEALDQAGILRDIGGIMVDEEIAVTETRSASNARSGKATLQLQIEVNDLPTLSRAISRIEALPYVLSVRRNS